MTLKVIVREYERGWGSSILEVIEFDSIKLAEACAEKINSKNVSKTAPDYYIQAEVVIG